MMIRTANNAHRFREYPLTERRTVGRNRRIEGGRDRERERGGGGWREGRRDSDRDRKAERHYETNETSSQIEGQRGVTDNQRNGKRETD